MSKKCWDHLQCSDTTKEVCPAYRQDKGSSCWTVEGTHCRGEIQGNMAEKIAGCRECDFYKITNNVAFGLHAKLILILLSMMIVPVAMVNIFVFYLGSEVVQKTMGYWGLFLVIAGAGVAYLVAKNIADPIKALADEAFVVSGGDLTGDLIKVKNKDEVGILTNAFNEMFASLKDLVEQVSEKANDVAESAGELNASAEECAAGSSEASGTINEITMSVEHITSNTMELAQTAQQTAQRAQTGRQELEQISNQMQSINQATDQVGLSITSLNEKSSQITRIIDLITNIAEQTNLLALNAAIEAARAGDQGRGFAVVADEVRHLAEQSAGAAQEISQLVQDNLAETQRAVTGMDKSAEEVRSGTEIINQVGGSLQEIVASVEGLNQHLSKVSMMINEISGGAESMSALSQEQAASMEQISASSEGLNKMSHELQVVANRFKI